MPAKTGGTRSDVTDAVGKQIEDTCKLFISTFSVLSCLANSLFLSFASIELENLKTPGYNEASDSASNMSGKSAGIGDILKVQVDFAKLTAHLSKIKKGMSKQKSKLK